MKEMKENEKFCSDCTICNTMDINRNPFPVVGIPHVPRFEGAGLQLVLSVQQVKQNAKLDSREARRACQFRAIVHDQVP